MIEIKKKKKNKWGFRILFLALLAAGALGYRQYKKAAEMEINVNLESAVVLEEGQFWELLQIDSIVGNEMEGIPVQESEEGYTAGEDAESESYRIAVGTVVVTTLQSETTFSRLAAGDVIRCLMQETTDGAEILKIWMKE